MSVHPSLGSKDKSKRNRSVLKRFEKLKTLFEKEKWKPGDSVFGLQKIKAVRWKIKKAKKEAEEEGAEGAAPAAGKAAPAGEKAPAAKEKKSDKK
jgi:small basic protein (TIGR04137 family)